ncbi:MAG: symmetrical bis(5'-nucleosyl)-tetraphosphatase [Burkholderiaceae bacterium]|nr:symmetrical bis(5'-nucleosyl)-tetraphosphatase [Burkholderiaceae bacterium]
MAAELIAIGDVQGCLAPLIELIAAVSEAAPGNSGVAGQPAPQLLFTGDLVNRGPQSLATLRFVRSLGERASVVLGNHDLHLLAVASGVRPAHHCDTFDEILAAPDRDELLDWLRARPLAHQVDGHLLVHAGVLPQWDAAQTIALAAEVETVLRGTGWVDFLRTMYGNRPTRWSDELRGEERLRVIVNALTRMRFISADGEMDFTLKEGVAEAPPGYLPWFEAPGRRSAEVTVVFGHWSMLGLIDRPRLIGLDTGCVWGGALSAVRLADRALFQVSCPQAQVPGRR